MFLLGTIQSRTWAEISLDRLAHNYSILRKMVPETCRFMGVVKANAYGHGAKQIGLTLQELGADMLAVACLDEAIELRRAGIRIPVFCLGYTAPDYAPLLLEHQITQTVSDELTARAYSDAAVSAGKQMTVHIKLDTGMTRIGFRWTEHERAKEEIIRVCGLPGLRVEGMFTHLSSADADENYTQMQLRCFEDAKQTLAQSGIRMNMYHCAASSGILNYPESHMDIVRAGIAMYGYPPTQDNKGLLPVMTLKSRVVAVRSISAETYVSYGHTAKLSRDSRLAVLPVGYADGYFRSFSNGMTVLLNGRRCPVVGRVCMDMCMVDVTDLPDVKVGDVAIVYGAEDLVEEGSRRADTIPYELLVRVAPRVPRVYLEE